jgi:hypothetical protein
MGRRSKPTAEEVAEQRAAFTAHWEALSEQRRQSRMRKNSETYATKRRAAGLKRISVWVPESAAEDVRAYALGLLMAQRK